MDDWAYCQLAPGDSMPVTFPEIRFTKFGRYTSACSVHVAGEQNNLNDKKLDTFEVAATGVAEAPSVPLRYGLSRIPNPCRGPVRLEYALPPGLAVLRLYDIAGRAVLTRALNSREKQITLDLRHLNAGIYVLRLNAGTFACSQKMILQH
jgi:hypothetical protein